MTRHDGAGFPLQSLLGMVVDTIEPGRAVARVTVGGTHLNPNGVVHGGVLFTMIDTAMGMATMSLLGEGQCASIEIHIRFLRPTSSGHLEALASVVRHGRRVIHLESRVEDEAGNLVATGTGTFMALSS